MKVYILLDDINFVTRISGVFKNREDAQKEILKFSDALQEVLYIEEHQIIE